MDATQAHSVEESGLHILGTLGTLVVYLVDTVYVFFHFLSAGSFTFFLSRFRTHQGKIPLDTLQPPNSPESKAWAFWDFKISVACVSTVPSED